MSDDSDVQQKLFEFYTQGSVEYSALLLASTLGVFSPYAALGSGSHLSVGVKIVLGLVYVAFSFASGFCLSRLIGNVWLLYAVMPKSMKDEHDRLASKLDVFNLGKDRRLIGLEKYAKLIEYVAFFGPPLVYLLLLGFTLA